MTDIPLLKIYTVTDDKGHKAEMNIATSPCIHKPGEGKDSEKPSLGYWASGNPNGFCLARIYNEILEQQKGKSEYIVLVHDDVYLPEDWYDRLIHQIVKVELVDPFWGVIGVAGARMGMHEGTVAKLYEGHLLDRDEVFQGHSDLPVQVDTVDEVCMVLHNDGHTRFAEQYPSQHLIGAELCLRMKRDGASIWCVDAYLEHRSEHGLDVHDGEFYFNAGLLAQEYADMAPIATTCITLHTDNFGMWRMNR